jgi:hypothetical protein
MSLTNYNTTTSTGSPAAVPAAVVTILGSSSPVGGAIATGAAVLQLLGISIRGKTQKLSFAQVEPKATDFGLNMWKIFSGAFSPAQILQIQEKVPGRFENAMMERWGVGSSLNGNIIVDIKSHYTTLNELNRQFALFYIWVGTNVDAESDTEFLTVLDAFFAEIFLGAVGDAGLSTAGLKAATTIVSGNKTTPTGTSTGFVGPLDPSTTEAGVSGSALGLIAIAGLALMFLGKK